MNVTKRKVVRPGRGKTSPTPPYELLCALRFALGLTQQEMADRSSGLISRNVYTLVELGRSKLTVRQTFRGVAKGLGLTEQELDALLEKSVGVDVLAARVLEREPALREGAERAAARAKAKG